ncbi:MAG: putative DNA binding domain-containing protein [Erysipelotrichaceae bacterium]|nr:putative DNA binding domain-containing protein [Erysipelotrichaceae bacterium]
MTKYIESECVELKRELIDEVKSEIVAFLNSKGGTIYVGVEDDGTIIGFNDEKTKDEIDLKVGNWLSEAFFPKPSGLITYEFNEDNVLEIKVAKGDNKPYFLREKGPKPSGVFVRVGRSKRKASEDEILKMILKSHKYSYEEDLSDEQDLTFKELSRAFEENDIEVSERLFNNLGLKNSNGYFTNLAYLLSDQSEITVKLAEYDEGMNFRIKKSFRGSLIKLIREVEEQAERLNDVKALVDGRSFKRIETKSYPGASIREMVMNAFCHADYFIRSNIKIEFFPDRVRICSPGGVFNASLDEIMNGIQTYRNPRLVHVLDKLGMIENFGTGIPRTLKSYENYFRQPEFKASENFFIVTLPNVNYEFDDSINDSINEPINYLYIPVNELGSRILALIKAMPGISAPGMAKILSGDDDSINLFRIKNEIKRNLSPYIEHRGSNKTGGYYLKKEIR